MKTRIRLFLLVAALSVATLDIGLAEEKKTAPSVPVTVVPSLIGGSATANLVDQAFVTLIERLELRRQRCEPEKMLKVLAEMEAVKPNHPGLWFYYGEVYGADGPTFDKDKAIDAFTRFLKLAPSEKFKEQRLKAQSYLADLEDGKKMLAIAPPPVTTPIENRLPQNAITKLPGPALNPAGAHSGGDEGRTYRDATKYVGTKSCAMCHRKTEKGNQFDKWMSSPHAHAFEVLGTSNARKVGAKFGIEDPQQSGKCLKCHVTAYNFTETKATDKVAWEDGVTCEACHGPGKDYKSKAVMENRQQCINNGMIVPATRSCVLCHNERSPTWRGDFNLSQALETIKHPDPSLAR